MEDRKTEEGVVVMGTWSASRKGKRQWSATLKKEVVMRLLRGEPARGISREMCVPEYKLERWRNCALAGIDIALRESATDSLQACLEDAYRRISELSAELEHLRKRRRSKRAAPERGANCCIAEGSRLSFDALGG